MNTPSHPDGPEDSSDALARTRRRLTPEELAVRRRALATHPADQLSQEEDLALGTLLDRLPSAPRTATNFTARVLAEIRRHPAVAAAPARRRWAWLHPFRFAPALTLATLALVVAGGWQRFRVHERGVLARNLLEVSRDAAEPGVASASFEDFDAVRDLHVSPGPDDDALVAALLKP